MTKQVLEGGREGAREGGQKGGREKAERKDSVSGKGREGVVGASLSEPHTSVTTLRKCVCIRACLRPYTVNFK